MDLINQLKAIDELEAIKEDTKDQLRRTTVDQYIFQTSSNPYAHCPMLESVVKGEITFSDSWNSMTPKDFLEKNGAYNIFGCLDVEQDIAYLDNVIERLYRK